MEKFKFALFIIIVLGFAGLASYWAIDTIQSGTDHQSSKKISELVDENEKLKKETEELKGQVAFLQRETESKVAQNEEVTKREDEKPDSVVEKPAPTTTYKHQTLISELQKLKDDGILMKLKSSGTRVGTVQNFLNIYKNTSNKVDNDYGESTKNAIMVFQKEQGLTADGEAGPGTFSKMIEWLKKQG